MGQTKKAIAKEVESVYENILSNLRNEVSVLTSEEKLVLREYIADLSSTSRNHSFCHVFILRKINDLVRSRDGYRSNCALEGIPEPVKKPSRIMTVWSKIKLRWFPMSLVSDVQPHRNEPL